MNWNGKHKNEIIGSITSCRENIATTKQRGSMSVAASWLLAPVDPEENVAALISLITPIDQWANSLDDRERETWLIWAMTHRPDEIRKWMGYADDWTMMPAAVVKDHEGLVRLAQPGRLPFAYLTPNSPRKQDAARVGPIRLENGVEVTGVELATVTYVLREGGWYKVHYPKMPSKSAITRAIRLYLLGVLVGRTLTSTTDLMMYELTGIKTWTSYGGAREGIAPHAGDTFFHLLVEPELGEQLNG